MAASSASSSWHFNDSQQLHSFPLICSATLCVLSYTGEGRALSKRVGQLFNVAADTFRNQLTTMLKKREQAPSCAKSLQVQVTIYDSYTHSLKMESDESYELHISEGHTGQVMCNHKTFLSHPILRNGCTVFSTCLSVDRIMVFLFPSPFLLSTF